MSGRGMWKLKERCVTWCEGFDDKRDPSAGAVMTGNHDVQSLYAFKNARLKRLREGMPECVAAPKVRSSGAIDPAPSITLNYPRQSFDTAHSRWKKSGDCAITPVLPERCRRA